MVERRKARAAVLAALFQWDLVNQQPDEALMAAAEFHELRPPALEFARRLLNGVIENREELDRWMSELAVDWKLERMAVIDRNILRIGAYELLYAEDLPVSVAINEAVELAKTYSTDDAPRFINGILGELARRVGREEVHRNFTDPRR